MRNYAVTGVLMLAVCASATAREVGGVQVPEQATLDDGTALVLNGAGIRSKFFVRVYVGALYLTQKETSAEAVVASTGPKRVLMHFLYDEVSREKLVDGWNDGFESNQGEAELAALHERIARFNELFPTVHRGDRILIDYVPGTGTQVRINDSLAGTVPGEDFHRAVLKIWLGDSPADRGLKDGMLGQ